MKKEMLEIVDENGNPTGEVIEKNLAHERNLLHKEVSLFIINSKNQVLLEKRSSNKKIHPNQWGLCAGHVSAYEDTITAMLRELKEELGVDATKNDITYFETILKKRVSNSNIAYQYYMFLDKDIKDFVIQVEELSEVMWMDLEKYKNMIINNDSAITLSNHEYNIKLIEKLENIIENHNKS